MTLLNGFKAFNFNEGAPYVSVTKNGVTFNKGVIMKLNYPEHVLLLINPNACQIAIQICNASTPNSTPFFKKKEDGNNVLLVRWNARDLLNTLTDMTKWDLENDSYRISGTLLSEENAMLFDFNNAELIK